MTDAITYAVCLAYAVFIILLMDGQIPEQVQLTMAAFVPMSVILLLCRLYMMPVSSAGWLMGDDDAMY